MAEIWALTLEGLDILLLYITVVWEFWLVQGSQGSWWEDQICEHGSIIISDIWWMLSKGGSAWVVSSPAPIVVNHSLVSNALCYVCACMLWTNEDWLPTVAKPSGPLKGPTGSWERDSNMTVNVGEPRTTCGPSTSSVVSSATRVVQSMTGIRSQWLENPLTRG